MKKILVALMSLMLLFGSVSYANGLAKQDAELLFGTQKITKVQALTLNKSEMIETKGRIIPIIAIHLARTYGLATGRLIYRALVKELSKKGLLKTIRKELGLGKGSKFIKNKNGDLIWLNKNRNIRVRFDIKNSGGDKIHGHIEKLNSTGRKWKDYIPGSHRIYPE